VIFSVPHPVSKRAMMIRAGTRYLYMNSSPYFRQRIRDAWGICHPLTKGYGWGIINNVWKALLNGMNLYGRYGSPVQTID
jgi:hypothetical protein